MMLRVMACLSVIGCNLGMAQDQHKQLSDSERRAIERLCDGFSARYDFDKYCVAGTWEMLNLKARDPSDPLTAISDFILCVDASKEYRRHSHLKESIVEGQLKVIDWYTRIKSRDKLFAGYDSEGKPDSVEKVVSTLPDCEPWDLSVACTFDIMADRCLPGYFSRRCDPSKAVAIEPLPFGKEVVFQVNEATQLHVAFSEKMGNMPVHASWRVSERAIDPNATGNSFPLIICETDTSWVEYDNHWIPAVTTIQRRNSFVGQEKRLIASWRIDYEWVFGEAAASEVIDKMPSAELREYLSERKLELR